MNWIDYFTGACFGMGLGSTFIGWQYTKTINIYKQIVKDYERMMGRVIIHQTGMTTEQYATMIGAHDKGEEKLRG